MQLGIVWIAVVGRAMRKPSRSTTMGSRLSAYSFWFIDLVEHQI
jgi:hypothetical protein